MDGELEAAKREADRQTREVGERDRGIGNMYNRLRERMEELGILKRMVVQKNGEGA